MVKNKRIRQMLFYGGFVLANVGIIMFIKSLPVTEAMLPTCGIVSVLFAFHKRSCPACQKPMWEVSADVKNCPFCEASYADQMSLSMQQKTKDEIRN